MKSRKVDRYGKKVGPNKLNKGSSHRHAMLAYFLLFKSCFCRMLYINKMFAVHLPAGEVHISGTY